MARFMVIPMLENLNSLLRKLRIDRVLDTSMYGGGSNDFWSDAAIIGSLAPPFTPILYRRPRVRQFGFLLSPQWTAVQNEREQQLMEWVDREDSPILFISMGSLHTLPAAVAQRLYGDLLANSLQNRYGRRYRVVWSIRQQIESGQSNVELERGHFKIMRRVPQFELLQSEKVALFLTHCGEGGVVEALSTKTLMALYPTAADQYFNAERVEQLGGGLVIRDRQNLTDLWSIIETLLLDERQRAVYQETLERAHAMIAYHGGVAEAVDFIEYASEFGTDHLASTHGVGYECGDVDIPWYQRTLLDVYVIVLAALIGGTVCIKKCVLDKCMFTRCPLKDTDKPTRMLKTKND